MQQKTMDESSFAQYQPPTMTEEAYESQLQKKIVRIKELFKELNIPQDIDVYRSPIQHYRMRADFALRHIGDEIFYTMAQPIQQQSEKTGSSPVKDKDGSTSIAPQEDQSNGHDQKRARTENSSAQEQNQSQKNTDGKGDQLGQDNQNGGGESGKPRRRRKARKDRGQGQNDKPKLETAICKAFPQAYEGISQLMEPVRVGVIAAGSVLKHKLFEIRYHAASTGDIMIMLIYHKPVDNEDWQNAATTLKQSLMDLNLPKVSSISIVGRSRGKRVVLGNHYVTEALTVNGVTYKTQQLEGSFSQPNASVCAHMLTWAQHAAQGLGGDLLELYGGNGNFSLALSGLFGSVVCTEISRELVSAAKHNTQLNGVDNMRVCRMSAEEFCEAWRLKQDKKRFAEAGIKLQELQLDTVLVDPPRAGLDEAGEQLLTNFKNAIYISCNPDTLAKNLKAVSDVFEVKKMALFDQFPYTDHIECGVLLSKNGHPKVE